MDPLSITLGITTLLALAKEVVFLIKEAKDASDSSNLSMKKIPSVLGYMQYQNCSSGTAL